MAATAAIVQVVAKLGAEEAEAQAGQEAMLDAYPYPDNTAYVSGGPAARTINRR